MVIVLRGYLYCLMDPCYFFGGPFFGGVFLAAGSAFLAAACRPPISVKESAALKGNCLADTSPVVLKVTSTRRLLARMIVLSFRRTLARSSFVSSGFCSTDAFTSAAVRLC